MDMCVYVCQTDQEYKLTSQIHVWKFSAFSDADYFTNKFIPVTFCLPFAQGRETISHSMISKVQLWT